MLPTNTTNMWQFLKTNVAESFEETQETAFLRWYPTQEAWEWRRTASYWIAVAFSEGSMSFLLTSFFGCVEPSFWGGLLHAVTTCTAGYGELPTRDASFPVNLGWKARAFP